MKEAPTPDKNMDEDEAKRHLTYAIRSLFEIYQIIGRLTIEEESDLPVGPLRDIVALYRTTKGMKHIADLAKSEIPF